MQEQALTAHKHQHREAAYRPGRSSHTTSAAHRKAKRVQQAVTGAPKVDEGAKVRHAPHEASDAHAARQVCELVLLRSSFARWQLE